MKTGYSLFPVELYRNRDYIKWASTAEASVWLALYARIVRSEMYSALPQYIYKNFYLENKLATGWRQEAIANDLGYGTGGKGNVSKYLKSLANKKFIYKREPFVRGKKTMIYELGYINKELNKETMYVVEYFIKNMAKLKLGSTEIKTYKAGSVFV